MVSRLSYLLQCYFPLTLTVEVGIHAIWCHECRYYVLRADICLLIRVASFFCPQSLQRILYMIEDRSFARNSTFEEHFKLNKLSWPSITRTAFTIGCPKQHSRIPFFQGIVPLLQLVLYFPNHELHIGRAIVKRKITSAVRLILNSYSYAVGTAKG